MNWEIREEKGGLLVWQAKDAEGRRIYSANRRLSDGTAIEPSRGLYSLRSALDEWREGEVR